MMAILITSTFCGPVGAREQAPTIEVFTDSKVQIVSATPTTTIYVIDGISHLQHALSRDLPGNAETAKELTLQRFQRLDARVSRALENAATGLVQAMAYNIDRYPAVVFDGEAIIYGVTDIDAATRRYRQWQAAGARP